MISPYSWVLLVCYVTSLLLVVLYFVWEDGPFHYSRRVESAYLSSVLSLIYFCSVRFGLNIFGTWERVHEIPFDETPKPENALSGLNTLRHLMLIILLLHIAQKFVVLRVLPTFYDTPGYRAVKREAKLWRIATRHPKAVRIAGEISDLVHSTTDIDSGLFLEFINKGTGFILLVLVMLSELTAHCDGFWMITCGLGFAAEVLAILLCLTHFIRRTLLLGAQVAKLNQLLEEVVVEKREQYLTYILASVSVATLMEISKEMLALLTNRALKDDLLDTTSKAILVDALQKAGLRSRQRQEAIGRILLSTYGPELTKLKNLIDGRAGYNNLFKLVYHDISNGALAEKVLQHLEAEAYIVQKMPHWHKGVKVLSDLDDTLFSSGGHFPAGCDRQFPKGVVYPGCLTLFRVLDKTFCPQKPSCNIIFLSARPHVYKEWMEEKSYKFFIDLMEQERIHTFPTLLPGQLSLGIKAMFSACCNRRNKTLAWREVGVNKFHVFKKFLRLYQEYDFIFCGDDGQGDLLAAQYMITEADEESGHCSDSMDSEDNAEAPESFPLHREQSSLCSSPVDPRLGRVCFAEEAEVISPPQSSEDASSSSSSGPRPPRRRSSCLRAALIHQVIHQEDDCVPLAKEHPTKRGQAWHEELRRHNLVFHKTYVGAAVELHLSHPDLVTLTDLQTVAQDAIQEFEEARLMYEDMSAQWQEAEADLVKDLERANQVLQAANKEKLRKPRGTTDIEQSETEDEAVSTQNDDWLNAGGLVGAGELRLRFVDLMPKSRRNGRSRNRRRCTTRMQAVKSTG